MYPIITQTTTKKGLPNMKGYKIPHTVKTSKLKLMRIKKQMKQYELAELSGVPLKCIGNYEQFRRDINHARVDIVYRLARALDCSIEELLDEPVD